MAANLVRDAEERGAASSEHLVEPTSGNTGMGLAMIANAKGYNFTATLSLAIPAEKRAALRLFGAKLVELADELCPMPGAPEGAMAKAAEIGEQPGLAPAEPVQEPGEPRRALPHDGARDLAADRGARSPTSSPAWARAGPSPGPAAS